MAVDLPPTVKTLGTRSVWVIPGATITDINTITVANLTPAYWREVAGRTTLEQIDYIAFAANKELIAVGDQLHTGYVTMNVTQAPFDNVKVRQAVNMAINKDRIVRLINNRGVPATQALPPAMPGYNSGNKGYAFDPEGAKKLLAEAGDVLARQPAVEPVQLGLPQPPRTPRSEVVPCWDARSRGAGREQHDERAVHDRKVVPLRPDEKRQVGEIRQAQRAMSAYVASSRRTRSSAASSTSSSRKAT